MKKFFSLFFLLVLAACTQEDIAPQGGTLLGDDRVQSKMIIDNITDNRKDFPNEQVPAYEKFEISFHIDGSVAQNLQFPFDASPPPGIDLNNPAYQGITVNALFSQDHWETVFSQPAFYYQEFDYQVIDNREWYYPTENYAWKVRFSPPEPGDWQFKITAEDASGYQESSPLSFVVIPSSNHGFIRVSNKDPRYFEFMDGTYFPGLGYNLTGNQINTENPLSSSQQYFAKTSKNGIQLFRYWLSAWGIYTSAWNPWRSITPAPSDGYIPFSGLTFEDAYTTIGSETSMVINHRTNPCMFVGWLTPSPAIKPNTNYRIRIRYLSNEIEGPRIPDRPFGLVAKMGGTQNGGWLLGDGLNCNDPGTGVVVSAYQSAATQNSTEPWQIIEGTWNSGDHNFLPYFYLVMENVNRGRALVDYVWLEEDFGDGQFGPNVLSRPWMSHHLYFEQRSSLAFDQVVEAAHENNIYLKLVTLEKNEWTMNHILSDGSFGEFGPQNQNFYGDWRETSKVRWLQQAWWRYIQARWGYSPNIHSWELLNEGDPSSDRHYTLADEFGKFMHCGVFEISQNSNDAEACQYEHPNSHLVTTSFWHSFPANAFWASENYPNIDYADLHAYNSTGRIDNPQHEKDAALYHIDYSARAYQILRETPGEFNQKPIMRGEAGIDFKNEQVEQPDLEQDRNGVWLHNFLWSTLDAGGMMEQYWWNENIEQNPGPDGNTGLYEIFAALHDFLIDIPLNNGYYVDAKPQVTNPNLRVVGQKDTTNNQAHLWIQHKEHTWRNVVDGIGISSSLFGEIHLDGFSPGTAIKVSWYSFTTQGVVTKRETNLLIDESGRVKLQLPEDPRITDIGIKFRISD